MTSTAPESSFFLLFLYLHLPAGCVCVCVCVSVCPCGDIQLSALVFNTAVFACITTGVFMSEFTFAYYPFVHTSSCIMSCRGQCKLKSPHPCRFHYIFSVVNKDQGTQLFTSLPWGLHDQCLWLTCCSSSDKLEQHLRVMWQVGSCKHQWFCRDQI